VIPDYCREIETYLCRKNDGHLIRVVGPSFEIVSSWAARGVPLKIAFEGIDRYFERYYRSGPRRRPVKVDFCDSDVLDVFDEWRRATGVDLGAILASQVSTTDSLINSSGASPAGSSSSSLPHHLERVVTRLTTARASGALGEAFDGLIDRAAAELDAARAKAGGIRGEARTALLARLTDLDEELVRTARAQLNESTLTAMRRDADEELAPFRAGMKADAYARARDAAVDHLVRARFNLPITSYHAGV
jgi:hypothetical protein